MGLAAFTQRVTGFGLALVSVPLLVHLLPIANIAPLLSLFGIIVNLSIIIPRRDNVDLGEVWRLAVALLPSIPIGVWALSNLSQELVLGVLGVVLALYGLYCLLTPRLPRINNAYWAFPFGFAAGMLGGAYNTTGPPAIIYGSARQWEPEPFKANLQAFFMTGNVVNIISHGLSGNINRLVWEHLAVSAVAALVGIWLGGRLDRYLKPDIFRRVVQVALVLMGVSLII